MAGSVELYAILIRTSFTNIYPSASPRRAPDEAFIELDASMLISVAIYGNYRCTAAQTWLAATTTADR